MIQETTGNLLKADAQALVNAVNCVGVMGKGIALQFRKKFPADYFKEYKRACESGELHIGKVHVFSLDQTRNPQYVINFPTKDHWKQKSKIEYIESGLQNLIEEIEKNKIESIALPALSCGLGGLDFEEVRVLTENAFAQLPAVKVLLFLPNSQFQKINQF